MQHPLPTQRQDTESKARKRRYLLLSIFGILLLLLVSILFRLQILEYGTFGDKVLKQITVGSSLPAERGAIYDRNGNLLATNRTVWRIYISPTDIRKAKKKKNTPYDEIIAHGLSEILDIPYETILNKAQKSAYLDQTITKSADEETVRAVLLFARDNGLASMVHTEAGTERYYPFGTLAAHTIGFAGSDNQGLFGLEAYYNSILSGTDGKYLASVDSQGIKLPNAYTDYIAAEAGLSLVTTLDVYLQRELENTLSLALHAADAQNRATGIVMNVKTGEILAMATAPSFNLNDPYTLDEASMAKLKSENLQEGSIEYKAKESELLYRMWNNKAVSEIYEPGSTFKIVTVAAALETGVVTPQTGFHCPGYYMVGGRRISCHKHGGHGALSLSEGLMHSCNPVMMQCAERMGSSVFYRYYQAFGYTEKTGIDLPGEGMGLFHTLSALGSTELATASFGQRFKVSILQQITAVATVANDGTPTTPHLISSLQNTKSQTVFTYQAASRSPIISKATAETVASILEAGVSGNGGAKNAYVEGYHVAAKTGTSEKFEVLDANGNSYLRIGSCVAFAPYDDAEIAVIIVVDEPTSANKYGSATAAPYISLFLENALPYLGIAKEKNEEDATVANYVGIDLKKAQAILSASGLGFRVIGDGNTVIAQSPAQGTLLEKSHGKVLLYTENKTEYVAVPDIKGKTLRDAMPILINAGLNIHISGAKNGSSTESDAVVITQSLPPGTRVEAGTCVTLTIYHTSDTD